MSGVILHSGAFLDRNDNEIKVTFYKDEYYLSWKDPMYQYIEHNISSGDYVDFSRYFNYGGTLMVEPSPYIMSQDDTTIHFKENSSTACAVFSLAIYVLEDAGQRLTIRFNMMPQNRFFWKEISWPDDVIRYDGHQALKVFSLTTDTDDVPYMLGENLSLIGKVAPDGYRMDPDWMKDKVSGDYEDDVFLYPDLNLTVFGNQRDYAWWYICKCQYPHSSGTHIPEITYGQYNYNLINTWGYRSIPVKITSLTDLDDACEVKLGDHYDNDVVYNAPKGGGVIDLLIYSGYGVSGSISTLPQAELVDYEIEFIDLTYGTEWLHDTGTGRYPLTERTLSIDENNTGKPRCIGIRVTHNTNPNNWAECMIYQEGYSIESSVAQMTFGYVGGIRDLTIWSGQGEVALGDSQYDWIHIASAGTPEPVPGTRWNKYKYRITVDTNDSMNPRMGRVSAYVESGPAAGKITKDILITQGLS